MNPLKAAINYYHLSASWLGDGGQPVPIAQAQARADTCLACPMNNPNRSIWETITAAVSKQLRLKLELKLHVERESSLHVCDGCDCYLPLKVWVPLRHVLETTEMDGLHAKCWITRESKTTT